MIDMKYIVFNITFSLKAFFIFSNILKRTANEAKTIYYLYVCLIENICVLYFTLISPVLTNQLMINVTLVTDMFES